MKFIKLKKQSAQDQIFFLRVTPRKRNSHNLINDNDKIQKCFFFTYLESYGGCAILHNGSLGSEAWAADKE